MKRGYKYEAEMLHWLDGGDIEMRYCYEPWEPFDGFWAESDGWEYRIAEPELCEDEGCDHHGTVHVCVSPKEERWLYVNKKHDSHLWIAEEKTEFTIGKIRMEDV
jgi:hypothetical protein